MRPSRPILRCCAATPTHFGALTNLGGLALASGHRAAALSAYTQAADHHPDRAPASVNLANLLLEDGAFDEARRRYRVALVADSGMRRSPSGPWPRPLCARRGRRRFSLAQGVCGPRTRGQTLSGRGPASARAAAGLRPGRQHSYRLTAGRPDLRGHRPLCGIPRFVAAAAGARSRLQRHRRRRALRRGARRRRRGAGADGRAGDQSHRKPCWRPPARRMRAEWPACPASSRRAPNGWRGSC